MEDSPEILEEETILREIFYEQAIFSITLDYFGEWLLEIINSRIIYDDLSVQRMFLSLFKDDPEYDLVKQRLLGMGIEIQERGDLEWATFPEPMGANEKIGRIMEGRTVSQIEGSQLYPGIVCRDGRAHFLVNYTKEARDEVIGRLEGFVKACSEVLGPKSFSIDQIDEPKGYLSFLSKLEVRNEIVEVVVDTRFPGASNFAIKNLTSNASDVKLISGTNKVTLETTLFAPGSTYDIFKPRLMESIRSALGSFYLPLSVFGTCRDNKCRVNILFERKRVPGLIRVLMLMTGRETDLVVGEIKSVNTHVDTAGQKEESRKKNSFNHF